MNWRIRLALWITAILCPRIGKAQPRVNSCPDFLEPDELGSDDIADWAEYAARCESTRHHLNRCLNK